MPSASQTVLLAPTDRAALCARSVERTRLFGLETSVATSGMGKGGSLSGDGIIRDATLIAGPTASGKSAMALDIAERENGIIVNADSMQVYSVLDLLTARPTAADLAARAARALRPCPSLGRLFDRRVAARRLAHRRRRSARRAAADLRRRHRPLFPGAGRAAFRRCRRFADDVRDRWRQRLRRQRAAGTASHSAARRSRGSASAEAGRRAAHRARAGGAGSSGRSILAWQKEAAARR